MRRAVVESWLKALGDLLIGNLRSTMLPLPIDKGLCTRWAEGLGVPRGGDTIIYTSCLYQLVPAINKLVSLVGAASRVPELARRAPLGLMRALTRPDEAEAERMSGVVRRIAELLRRSGVEFGYLYEEEPYSGALLYELGFEEAFKEYSAVVARALGRARRVITIDPHTHNLLRNVLPKYQRLDAEVVNYMELIKGVKPSGVVEGEAVVHDSCLYSRYLGLRDAPRRLLDEAGIARREDPYVTGVATSMCCGGPVESINPSLSNSIAAARARDLSRLSKTVVVACPICLGNLSRNAPSGVRVVDLAEAIS